MNESKEELPGGSMKLWILPRQLSVAQRGNPFSMSSRGRYHSRIIRTNIFNVTSPPFTYAVVVSSKLSRRV